VAAFATGVPADLYAFHHYTGNSTTLARPPVRAYRHASRR
jgi:hypothetical protein